jgi:hypothetical protein
MATADPSAGTSPLQAVASGELTSEIVDATLVKPRTAQPLPAEHSHQDIPLLPLDEAPPVKPPASELSPAEPAKWKPQSWPVRLWHGVWSILGGLFGWLSLMIGLAALATTPVLQFICLGYLLDCSGRIYKSGRFRDGLIDISAWARIGSLFIGTWLCLLIPRGVAELANDADLIHNGGPVAQAWRVAQFVITGLVVGHILLAWYCGGKLRHFFWPLLAPFSLAHWVITSKILGPLLRPVVNYLWPKLADDLYQPQPLTSWFPPAMLLAGLWRGPVRMYVEARDATWEFVQQLQLFQRFWLGLRGFVGAVVWLVLPLFMMISVTKLPKDGPAGLFGFIGSLLFATVLMYLPFLQTHFAAENRFEAMFELGRVRQMFRRAPIAFWFSLLITLALALPPYLFKIQKVYAEFDWLFSFLFVFLVYPGRLLTGWAMGLANHREKPRFILFRWGARLAIVPICLIYVLIVFLTQYTSWFGSWSLFEQHPFLLPVPFFSG